MRRLRTLGFFAVMIVLGNTGRSLPVQGTNPSGSYQQTCSDISMREGALYASCKDDKGKTHHTKLASYGLCSTDIVNKNGHLECLGPLGPPPQPQGSYTESCRDIEMKGSTLTAVCRSLDGRETPSSLKNTERCTDGVVNVNGILNCRVNDVLPPGSYISTCKDVRLTGNTLYASCDNGKGKSIHAALPDANKCGGDIANHKGTLRCVPVKVMEKR